jgi:hypothetical protein
MRHDDLSPDPALRDMLRRFDPASAVTPAGRQALARRIAAGASPILAARRRTAPSWWEFTAGWARTLIPLGVATALVAAGTILWASRTAARSAMIPVAAPDSLVGAVPHDHTSQHLVDFLVTPTGARVAPVPGHE